MEEEMISGGSKGARGARAAPGPNFFIFIQLSGKIGQIVCWNPLRGWRHLLRELLNPPLMIYVN